MTPALRPCRAFQAGSGGRRLFSGGNGGTITLWDWQRAASGAASDACQPAMLSIKHAEKVNWLCSGGSQGETLLVADVGHDIAVYTLRCD